MRVTSNSFAPRSASGFIVLEGVNGAGKTTLQNRIAEFFKTNAQEVITTREPGATALGKTLRSLVLEHPQEAPCEMAELFIFAADRAQHVEKIIRPGTARGAWVISDRYFYSTVAFQGYGRGINQNTINQINALAIAETRPDLVILLDLDPATGLQRTQRRQHEPVTGTDTFEKETLAFHTRIREGFLSMADSMQEAFAVIDAAQNQQHIFDATLPYLQALLKAPRVGVGA
ncbi:MAG: dTMP kinase [Deltaproteobacteria bacterium]|nr:dTMP kinase [Deltaproteobacteria bacterium]